eukprot:TRINITY_DN124_c0_g1_i1.p1 TRINITY_DN124_c0_g1~~TRINITY_DN124_c0_g1_i1.p1  ORF type:complete len:271 (-),score=62.78 TRINITY_DN124_c0_g1_i1:27-839(-)
MEPSKVFNNFRKDKYLLQIAYHLGLVLTERQTERESLINILTIETKYLGIRALLRVLNLGMLQGLCESSYVDMEPTNKKNVMAARISESMNNPEVGVKKVLKDVDIDVLKDICKFIDELDDDDMDYPKKQLVNAFCGYINDFGLTNVFENFRVSELRRFCKTCGIEVSSTMRKDAYVSAITSQDDAVEEVSESPILEPSKKKPSKIDKNISKADLKHYFVKDELIEYCRENDMLVSGNRIDLERRILDSFSNKRKRTGNGSRNSSKRRKN